MSVDQIPASLQSKLVEVLSKTTDKPTTIQGFQGTRGGHINNCGILDTNVGQLFIKWNAAARHPETFRQESVGLKEIAQSNSVKTPKVWCHGSDGVHDFLILDYIQKNSPNEAFWNNLSLGLAKLHNSTSDQFGFKADNYYGHLKQNNSLSQDWWTFYLQQRLVPVMNIAIEKGLFPSSFLKKLNHWTAHLMESELTPKQPGLIHGDLWSGNLICGEGNIPYIIDPAVYYADPRVEVAYMLRFGNFPETLFQQYYRITETPPISDQLRDWYNLYPILIHAIAFDRTYQNEAREIILKYS